jgi:DNA repair exonuclease SbcCD ATPase subunit
MQRERDALAAPKQKAHDHLTHLHRTLNDGARLLGEPETQIPALPGITAEAAFAQEQELRHRELARAIEAARAQRAKGAKKASDSAVNLLGSLDVNDVLGLEALLIGVQADQRRATDEEARLRKQISTAAELNRRLEPLGELEGALDELCRLLRDGSFIAFAFAVERRQLALLGTASLILAATTGDRYGFSKDFEIVDKLSGQPQSPRTFSGGESFLASLASRLGW